MTVARVLITGRGGQLADALSRGAPARASIVALGQDELDLREPARVVAEVRRVRPSLIINAAAYTAVDKAESEPELAFAVNRDGAATLAEAACDVGSALIHVSTDFVFDGEASSPYAPSAPCRPLSIYGRSKLEGERAVLSRLPSASVVRTAWLYSSSGSNFLRTMLRLMRERGAVRVVADQVGTPTSVTTLARFIWHVADARASGILHWTDAGVASWYDVAVAIAEEAVARGVLASMPTVEPITTADFPTPARRPAYSVLDKSESWRLAGPPVHWREPLRTTLSEIAHA